MHCGNTPSCQLVPFYIVCILSFSPCLLPSFSLLSSTPLILPFPPIPISIPSPHSPFLSPLSFYIALLHFQNYKSDSAYVLQSLHTFCREYSCQHTADDPIVSLSSTHYPHPHKHRIHQRDSQTPHISMANEVSIQSTYYFTY